MGTSMRRIGARDGPERSRLVVSRALPLRTVGESPSSAQQSGLSTSPW